MKLKFKLPKFPKLPRIPQKTRKRIDKNLKTVKNAVAKRTAFLGVWRRKVLNIFHKVGQKIHDVSPNWLRRIASIVAVPFKYIYQRIHLFLQRRPHRSFRLTRRRDYVRSLRLPGYWAFTFLVIRLLWSNKKLFGSLILVYAILYAVIAGVSTQESYSQLTETIKQTGDGVFTGAWGKVGQAGILLASTFATGLNPSPNQLEGVLTSIMALMTWLTVVWLLRNLMAGHTAKLRDGIYSSGAPIMATSLVGVILAFQLIPVGVMILIYDAASLSGLLDGGIEAMLFWLAAVLVVVGVLYWVTSTIMALVIVTLPGMYPFTAISAAGDLVVGRRVRILLRISWAFLLTVLIWLIIAIPIIMFDSWLKAIIPAMAWVPAVPATLLLLLAISIVWLASYVYILYRKVVEDDAGPV